MQPCISISSNLVCGDLCLELQNALEETMVFEACIYGLEYRVGGFFLIFNFVFFFWVEL